MIHIVLYQPEIPPNTGNIIRLCANTGSRLHLIEPLGFSLSAQKLRRAGMDYREFAEVRRHAHWEAFLEEYAGRGDIWPFSTRGSMLYHTAAFGPDDALLFGPETRGLPKQILEDAEVATPLRLPMQTGSRSLNLSNSAAIGVYEALRQLDFGPLS